MGFVCYLRIAPLPGYVNRATAWPNESGPLVKARTLSCAMVERYHGQSGSPSESEHSMHPSSFDFWNNSCRSQACSLATGWWTP